MGGVSEPDGMPVDCVPHVNGMCTHVAMSGRRVLLTIAVKLDRTATVADVERIKRDLGGYRCGVRVEADGQGHEQGREGGAEDGVHGQ